jgi:hypothetical protein
MPPVLPTRGGGGSVRKKRRRSKSERLERALDRAARTGVANANRKRDPMSPKNTNDAISSKYKNQPSARAQAAAARAARKKPAINLARRKATRNLDRGTGGGKPNSANDRSGTTPQAVKASNGPSNGPGGRTNNRTGGGGGPSRNRGGNGGGGGKNNKPGKGGNKGKGGAKGGGGKVAKDDTLSDARRSVGLEINPQLAAIMREVEAAKARLEQEKASINGVSETTRRNLSDTYGMLGQYLEANQAQGDATMATGQQAVSSGFDGLLAALGQQGQQAQAGVSGEMARLGLTGAGDTGALQRDTSLLQGLAGINQQSALAGLTAQRGSFNGLQDQLQGNAQASGANHQAAALRAALDQIMGAEEEFTGLNNKLVGEYNTLEGSRGARVQEMIDTIKQAQFEQEMELSQQAFMNQMTQDKFGLDVAQLRSENKQARAGTRLERARLDLERQKAAQTAADKAADRRLREKEAAAKAAGGGASGSFRPTGFSGAVQVIQQSQKNPYQAAKLETIIRKVRTGNERFDPTNSGDMPNAITWAKSQLKKMGIDSMANRRIVADAVTAFYGKYGGA